MGDKITGRLEELRKCFSRDKNIMMAYLFGSHAEGKETKISDLDIGVFLSPEMGREEIFKKHLFLIGEVSKIMKTDRVDVVIMNESSASLNFEIIKHNAPIYVRSKGFKNSFEESVIRSYLDRRFYEKRFTEGLLNKIAVEGI